MTSELTFRDLLKAQVEGKTVQYWAYSEGGKWVDCQMSLQIHVNSLDNIADSKKFRIKPETVLTSNGYKLPPCIKVEPKVGDVVFVPDPVNNNKYKKRTWSDSSNDRYLLYQNLLYTKAEDAVVHGRIMTLTFEEDDLG